MIRPGRPQTGQLLPVGYDALVWDWIRSQELSGDGKTVRVTHTPGGTTISLLGLPPAAGGGAGGTGGSGAYKGPFTIESVDPAAGSFRIVGYEWSNSGNASSTAGYAIVNGINFALSSYDFTVAGEDRYLVYIQAASDAETGAVSVAFALVNAGNGLLSPPLEGSFLLGYVSKSGGAVQLYRGGSVRIDLYWEGEP